MVDTSFVVIAYNEERAIERTLRSIVAQRDLPEHEVLVVDDGSADATVAIAERVAAEHPSVRVLALGTNQGRGAARAAGIGAATGRFIATIDADIVLPTDWFARCRAEIEDHDAVGGIATPDGDVALLYRLFGLEPRVVKHSTQVTGSNALYRREVFDAVAFDPSLRNGEDVALNHAMQASETRMRSIDGLVVRHEEHKTFRGSVAWLFESGIGASRQLRRYRQVRLPDLAFGAWAASALLGVVLGRRRRAALGLPAAFTLTTAIVHVRQKFVVRGPDGGRAAGAVLVHAVLLTAYFLGRAVGLVRD